MSERPSKQVEKRGRESVAFRAGLWAQAALLALVIAMVVLRLVQLDDALKFRYGGF